MLFRVLLVSQTTLPAYGTADREISRRGEIYNRDNDLGGFLLREINQFYQVLEGRAHVVNALIQRQLRDRRHFQLTQIAAGPVRTRIFDGWAMGYNPEASRTLGSWHGLAAGQLLRPEQIDPDTMLSFLHSRSEALRTKGVLVQRLAG